ncbi:aminotransferase class V-fold PLP-dependent enzyme [Lacibacter sp. H375]|uniref:aminotransferase class V-fold PLP-dependent enzyme n=1 Tax=Lacibacter sp. H375 TaxID=3133424 RepID=UPI0030BDE4A5
MKQDRKYFLRTLGTGLVAASLPAVAAAGNDALIDESDFIDEGEATDEKFWKKIAKKYYEIADDHVNLENGFYGIQPKPVLEAFQKNVAVANKQAARFARKDYPAIAAAAKKEVAAFLGVSDDEIIITRNATEALNIAIQGYPFKQGDEVILNQLDYFSMIETFKMLEKRGAISVKEFEMPLLPGSEDEIVDIYRKLITPKTRVILLTHVSNINGLIVPVAKIAAMAKERGVDVMTDSAHALGQINFSLKELNSDFVGMNLHKWIGNPVGAGILYVKKERIKELKAFFGDTSAAETSINKLAHFGTTPFAVIMTIPTSLAFQKQLGIERISARLHYLKSIWVNELMQHPNVEVVVPADFSCGIASFRIKNKTAVEVADYLFKQHKIFTVARTLGKDGCVRVTPSVYNSADDVRRFVAAVKSVAAS